MNRGLPCRRKCCTEIPEPKTWTPLPAWAEWRATYVPEGNRDD